MRRIAAGEFLPAVHMATCLPAGKAAHSTHVLRWRSLAALQVKFGGKPEISTVPPRCEGCQICDAAQSELVVEATAQTGQTAKHGS